MPDLTRTPNLNAMIVFDRAGRIVHANDIAKRFSLAAFGRELAVGAPMTDFATDESREDIVAGFAAAAEGKSHALRRVLHYPTGITVCFDLSYEPLVIDGEVRYVILSAHDMSRDLLDLQKAALFSRALDQTTTGVILCDARVPDYPIVHANTAFSRITGYRVTDILGRNCRFLQGAETSQPGLEIVRKTLREGTSCTVVLRNYRKDGTPFLNRLALSSIRGRDGQVTHFVGIQEDVTATHHDRSLGPDQGAASSAASAVAPQDRADSVRTILLVDDDTTIRTGLSRALRKAGFVVREASSAAEAETLIEAHDFAALISDVLLPDGGADLPVVHAFRKRHPSRPIILASGIGGSELANLVRTHRASVLLKPFRVEELIAHLDRLLPIA
jgi:PAS domain S-box-containing protein